MCFENSVIQLSLISYMLILEPFRSETKILGNMSISYLPLAQDKHTSAQKESITLGVNTMTLSVC